MNFSLDTNLDFRRDVPEGKDPDKFSLKLKQHHKFLWNRALPSGKSFVLIETAEKGFPYLKLITDFGEFAISSDSVIPTFSKWKRTQALISQIPENEILEFRRIGYSIGGMMIWPTRNELGGKSINQIRGMNNAISDRMDLTLECIHRYYKGEGSPLNDVLSSNPKYFDLFGGFNQFVEHFLLQDLVDVGTGEVKFFLPFDDFKPSDYPKEVDSYQIYRLNSLKFVEARNDRISRLVAEKPEMFGGAN